MNTGGPAVFLDHLTNAMKDLDTQSTIAFGYCELNETDYTKSHKLNADLISINSLHRSLNPYHDLKSFIKLRKIIKVLEPDLVNTHTSKAGVLGRLAAKSVNKKLPVVHTFHGHLIYGYFARYKSLIFTLIEKFMSFFTDASVAVTEETKFSLSKLGIGKNVLWKVIQIGIPVNTKPLNKISEGSALKMLWVGRFTEIKDPAFAVEVMKYISANSKDNHALTMVGEGELFEKIKELSKEVPIRFTGWLANPFENISEFDLLLITSKNEGLPLVMLEAARYGRATISNDVGGVSEFITHNQTGYLSKGGPDQMSKLVLKIASNKNELSKIGINANNLLNEKFSVSHMAARYKNLYSNLTISK
jgi:glycosyltransferase involved in cell wall biosynthesis